MESASSNATLPKPQHCLVEALASELEKTDVISFLTARLDVPEREKDFCEWLRKTFPEQQDLNYVKSAADLGPAIQEDQIALHRAKLLHVSYLGFKTTPKRPLNDTVKKLAEQMLHEGFKTGSEPVLLMHIAVGGMEPVIEDSNGGLCNMFAQYYKGQTRCLTLLALLVLMWDDGWFNERSDDIYKLAMSIRTIHFHLIHVTNITSWVCQNAALSARSSLRKAWNIVQWMDMLTTFQEKTQSDANLVIKAWNAQAIQNQQLVGHKRTALNHLLTFSKNVQKVIFDTISAVGWAKAPYTEDFFASKRVLPGAKRTSGPKSWQTLTVITQESLLIFVRCLRSMTRRWNKADLEDLLTQISIGYNLAAMTAEMHSVPWDMLEQHWLEPIAVSSAGHLSELQSVFVEKKECVGPNDIHSLDALISSYKQSLVANKASPAKMTFIEQARLEEDMFQLVLSKVRLDVQAFLAWEQQCNDFQAAMYHKEKMFIAEQHALGNEAAKRWMENHIKICSAEACPGMKDVILAIKDATKLFTDRVTQKNMEVHRICLMNWTAPCLIRAELQRLQQDVFGFLLEERQNENMGILFMPRFSYTANTLWIQQISCLQWLGGARLNSDMSFTLLYKKRQHKADERPLNYDGKLVFAGTSHQFLTQSVWRGCSLVDRGCVTDAEQLKVSEIKKIEYITEESLPPSSVHGSEDRTPIAVKYAQLGSDAYHRLLNACFDHEMPPGQGAMICDLCLGHCNSVEAFVELMKTVTTPLFFWGLAETDEHLEWANEEVLEHITQEMMAGRLGTVPKAIKPEPQELPRKPSLLQCVWGNAGTGKSTVSLHIAERDLLAWQSRMDQIKDLAAEVGIPTLVQPLKEQHSGSPAKRAADGMQSEPPQKKQAVESLVTVPLDSITQQTLCDVQLTHVAPGLEIRFLAGDGVVLINRNKVEQTIPGGSSLLGFGKGKWLKVDDKPESIGPTDIEFIVSDSSSEVLHNGVVCKVGDLIKQQALVSPASAKVCYHQSNEEVKPGDPAVIRFTQRMKVVYQSTEQAPAKEKTESTLTVPWVAGAALAPILVWKSCPQLHILFTTKWTKKGLQPSSPMIVVKNDMTLDAERAFVIK